MIVFKLPHTGVAFVAALALLAPGCLYEPLGFPGRTYPPPRPSQRPIPPPAPRLPPGTTNPDYGPAARNGDRAAALLANEIAYRADLEAERRSGPESPGLSALRMTADAADLIAEDKDCEALELLERAVAIDDSSGFADLYLARVHYREGLYDLSREFLARARPLLPDDPRLDRSLDRLERHIRERSAAEQGAGT